jgi:formylmethanofuran dehydrogenase subunit A
MTVTRLSGGRVFDPANGVEGDIRDLFLRDGLIIADPGPGARFGAHFDLSGCAVMAGGIDMHSHIAGGKVNIARMMMVDDHRRYRDPRDRHRRSGSGHCSPSTFATGYRYAELGYTAVFEPAMLGANARHAHAELADIPMLDRGCYVLLGNDEHFLEILSDGADPRRLADYVGWTIAATQAVGVKIVNPGGIFSFKHNRRSLGFDDEIPVYGLTPRRILTALAEAVRATGIVHPLHVHCNDLGVPGNRDTTIATIRAAADAGVPLHLTHLQFHSYGTDGDRHFSSAAASIAELVNASPNITVDIGQIVFGQTITASGDTMSQYRGRIHAHPKTWLCMDIECDAGCGLVPFRYRDTSFVNALQWAIGLELFLLIEDPWRIFLTTDHPNGGPFTAYPHLIRLLMDRSFRRDMLKTINPDAAAATVLGGIGREYSLQEIAILTRAGPARVLGLKDRGHLGAGARADIAAYRDDAADRQAMFERPAHVFKDGRAVVRDGRLIETVWGSTLVASPAFDRAAIERHLAPWFERYATVPLRHYPVADDEITRAPHGRLERV